MMEKQPQLMREKEELESMREKGEPIGKRSRRLERYERNLLGLLALLIETTSFPF